MKRTLLAIIWAVLIFGSAFCPWRAGAQSNTTFTFTLDEPCKTSAGVYAANGTLVRTLWSKVRYYAPGNYSAVWDGLDDCSNAVAAGVYQIKLLQHNTEYLWDGAIGNTSTAPSGLTVHRGYYPMTDMAISGTNAYYVTGYNEGGYDFRYFLTTAPQQVVAAWGADGQPANIYDPTFNWTATDGNWVYFACNAATNPTNTVTNNYPGFIVASKVGTSSPAYTASFTQGVPIINGANTNTIYPNGIYVGTQPGLSGLTVQQNGRLLAAPVAPDNQVYLMDKLSGAQVGQFYVNSPGRLNFSPDGSLWVISGNDVIHFTNAANVGADTNGLVALYPLAGNANDYSGNGNNGATKGNPSYNTGETGASGTAMSLNGNSQYVSLGHPGLYNFGTNDFTITLWFNTTSTSVRQQLLSCDDISGRQFVFDINDLYTGTVSAYLFSSDSTYLGYESAGVLSPNTWYMAVLVKSGNAPGAMTLYLNDAPVGSFGVFTTNDFPLDMQATGSEVDIGRRTYTNYNDIFSGSMAGVRVFDRALAESEIGELYASDLGEAATLYVPGMTISNLSEPLDVAVNPGNANLVLVADGGSSQQVKGFDSAGAPLWTYGQSGGYQFNGVAVTTNKFWFNNGQTDGTFVCFASDGSFWVGDGGNNRNLHFSPTCAYIEQIMFQPHSYMTTVDQNNPSRVINQFSEFAVDYTKPLSQGWTLVNNWLVGVPPANISWNEGLYEVTTFPNGRVYGLIDNNSTTFAKSELCELTTNQIRLTGLYPAYSESARGWISIGPDGSARRTTIGIPTWYEDTLTGFDESNNPIWTPDNLIATASAGSTDPVPRGSSFGNIRATISTNNILISFDQSLNNGWHLGGIQVGTSNWLWKASPAVPLMNGTGNYEISYGVIYAGNTLQAVDRNVVYGYHGEFFRGEAQACQNMHFYDDGLFVGQFGESDLGHSAWEDPLPGSAGNAQCPNLIKTTNGDYYLWVNDEGNFGPQRWHFVNAKDIRELTGFGALGGTISLTNPPCNFPTGVVGRSGNQSAELSWLPVRGASSYNLRYSPMNGGPYSALAASTTNLDCVVTGLTNGQAYYFAVTAVINGAEGTTSEQAPLYPFDTTRNVVATGSMEDGGQFTPILEIASGAPSPAHPPYLGADQDTGLLNQRELDYYGDGNLQNETLGTEGYVLYDWGGFGSNNYVDVNAPFSITPVSGWTDVANLERQFQVGSTIGDNYGWMPNPIGTINIGVGDTNYHYLTVVSPSQFNNPRQCTLSLTSTNGTSAEFTVNDSVVAGYSRVFQFLFRGNVTLTATSTAFVQAIFLDNAWTTPAVQSTTTLASSQNPAAAGSAINFTATVSGAIGTPTGTVSFFDGASNMGVGTLNGTGVATISAALPGTGSAHSITAVYTGDSAFGASVSSPLSQIVTGGNGSNAAPTLIGATMLAGGAFQFSFSNSAGASFAVLSTTNLSLPLSNWTMLGSPSNVSPGLFQFTASPATNQQNFYILRSQ